MIRLRRADSVRPGQVVRLPDERLLRVTTTVTEPGVVTLQLEDGQALLCAPDHMVRLANERKL